MQGNPNFLTRDLLILNNILSISHSSRPLTAGPKWNAENMEPLLYIGRLTWAVTWWRNTVGDKEEALELWIIIPSYSDSRFGVFLEFFVTPNFQSWAEVVRCWPIKSVRHTQTSQSESTFREAFSDLNTLPFFLLLPPFTTRVFPFSIP